MDAYSLYDAHAATTTTRRSDRHLPAALGAPPPRTPLTMSSSEPSSSILQLDDWTPHFGKVALFENNLEPYENNFQVTKMKDQDHF